MKAIILAAGMGTRLGEYTRDLPKCMLNFNGKTLLQRQIDVLRNVGINDIVVVRGYMAEKITIPGVKYYLSTEYYKSNMVETLFCAEEELSGNVLVCYGDIIYEESVLRKVLRSVADVGVVVDEDYWDYWCARLDTPSCDTESLVVKDEKIVDLGNPNCPLSDASCRYVGMIRFSQKGIDQLKKAYHKNRDLYYHSDSPWKRSKSFRKAYMTCMLQELIDEGYDVNPIVIRRGWLEFDNVDDYERYHNWVIEGSISKFCKID